MSTMATAIDYDQAITAAAESERKADEKAAELRVRQRQLLRDSLRGVDTSKELSQVERGLDRAARDAELARILGEEATAEKATAGEREKAEQRERASVELARLNGLRKGRLGLVEQHVQALAGDLQVLHELEVQVLTHRGTLGLGMGPDVRRLITDRISWVLSRAAGPGGLAGFPPFSSKAMAREPLDRVFAPADVAAEDRR